MFSKRRVHMILNCLQSIWKKTKFELQISDVFDNCVEATTQITHLIWSRSFVVYLELFNSKKNLLRVFEMFNKNQNSTRQDCTYYVIWV